jgi:hypothetical protein
MYLFSFSLADSNGVHLATVDFFLPGISMIDPSIDR